MPPGTPFDSHTCARWMGFSTSEVSLLGLALTQTALRLGRSRQAEEDALLYPYLQKTTNLDVLLLQEEMD